MELILSIFGGGYSSLILMLITAFIVIGFAEAIGSWFWRRLFAGLFR